MNKFITCLLLLTCYSCHVEPEINLDTSFEELPELAQYVNELFVDLAEEETGFDQKIKLKDQKLHFNYSINNFNMKLVQFSPRTLKMESSIEDKDPEEQEFWTTSYTLIPNEKTPTLVITMLARPPQDNEAKISKKEIERRKENFETFRQEIINGRYKVKADRVDAVAKQMLVRSKFQEDVYTAGFIWKYNPYFNLAVFQKKEGKWQSVYHELFEQDLVTKLNAHLPFLNAEESQSTTNSSRNGLSIRDAQVVQTNIKRHHDDWLGGGAHPWELEIKKNGNIELKYALTQPLTWIWTGEHYITQELPEVKELVTSPCPSINFEEGGMHRFKGTIGTTLAIEVSFEFDISSGFRRTIGTLRYLSQPDIVYKLSGELQENPFRTSSFYVLHEGNYREQFMLQLEDCKIKGFWQKFDNMEIYPFNLDLVQ